MTTRKNRLQNRVAGSDYTLPACLVMATAMWWLPWQGLDPWRAGGWAMGLVTAFAVLMTNEEFHLTRIRTRLMTCVWLLLAAAMPFVHTIDKPAICALCLALAHPLLFSCYQNPRPYAAVYHSFLFLGIGALFSVGMGIMAVLFCFYLGAVMRALSWKSFWAAVLGYATPLWLVTAWYVLTDDIGSMAGRLSAIELPQVPGLGAYAIVPLPCALLASLMCVLGTVAAIYYMRHNYSDKIHIRMVMYVYVMQSAAMLTALVLQPGAYRTIMAMAATCTGPLIAHYFAQSGSRISGILFIVSIILYAILAYLNIWMPSLTF